MRTGEGHPSRTGERARALFFVEYGLGHRTHSRFLEAHLAADPRFDAELVKLHSSDVVGALFGRLKIPPIHRRGLDFWTWWLMQFKRQQVLRLMRRRHLDRTRLDLAYFHTQTGASAMLDLPRAVPAVVSIDLTWKLAFRESRYVETPFFSPIYHLEQRIFERSDLIVSFSDWAAASVVEDYGIPAAKVVVVRNGVTLPNDPANGHAAGGGGGANGAAPPPPANGAAHRPGANGADGLLRLGFVGNEFARKGGDLLLRVHQNRFADQAHLTLVTGGVPPGNGLRNVSVRSKVPWDELMTTVVPGFDLFVFPTRFDYSPYAVIEAMTAGVPVLSTRVGAIPEMVEDGVSGFLIDRPREAPLAERMAWVMEHRACLPEMGSRARQRATGAYAAADNYPHLLDLLAGLIR